MSEFTETLVFTKVFIKSGTGENPRNTLRGWLPPPNPSTAYREGVGGYNPR